MSVRHLHHRASMRSTEAGMVTAEIAVGLTGLVFVLLAGLWIVTVVTTQVRCLDAARDTARAVARGETVQVARAAGRRSAPEGAAISIQGRTGRVVVTVAVVARPPWPALAGLPSVRVQQRATLTYEPGADPGADRAHAATRQHRSRSG